MNRMTFQPLFKVPVSATDILEGRVRSCLYCLVALAIFRNLGLPAHVGEARLGVRVSEDGLEMFDLSPETRAWIEVFDGAGVGSPFGAVFGRNHDKS